MVYSDMPVIIPLLATGYLLTIYLLLTLAQRTLKSSQYVANSVTDAYASYMSTDHTSRTDEVEHWTRNDQRYSTGRFANAYVSVSLSEAGRSPTERNLNNAAIPKELFSERSSAKLTTSQFHKVKGTSSTLT